MHFLTISGRQSGGAWIVRPEGSMTMAGGREQVRDTLMAKYEAGFRHLILDCSQITSVDSQGLGEIVGAYAAIVRRGGALRLLQPSKRVRELLKITRLDSLLESFDDEPTALMSFHTQADQKAKIALEAFLE